MTSDPAPPEETAILAAHLDSLAPILAALRLDAPRLVSWGRELRRRLDGGGRLLAAGNGGSAAQAQHLTAELVGRFERDRAAYSAIALHADTSSLTAIGNDYGYDEVFARQVRAHGRAGDILILLSTSGRSRNLLLAAETARERRVTTWALTGAAPNPLTDGCDDRICLPGPAANVQEGHLVALHMLCQVFDHAPPTGSNPAADTNRPVRANQAT